MIRTTGLVLPIVALLAACSGSSTDDDNAPPPSDDPVVGPDCLGDVSDSGDSYCVDAETRVVTATDIDGSQLWTVTLPRDDAGRIGTLVLLQGKPWVITVSNTPPACTASAAYFCTDTYDIARVGPDVENDPLRAIPLVSGGFPLVTGTSDYLFDLKGPETLEGRDVLAVGIDASLYIAADVYELMPDADRESPDSWQFIGGSVTRVDFQYDDTAGTYDSRRRAQRYYPGQHMAQVARTGSGKLLIALDSATERLDPATLLPSDADPEQPLFAGQPYEVVAPFLLSTLRGDGLDALAQRLDSLGMQARTSATRTEIVHSNAPDLLPDPEQGDSWDITEQVSYTCAGGGILTIDRKDKSETAVEAMLREEYRYENCGMQAVDTPSEPGGAYRLNGTYISDHYRTYGSFLVERTGHEWQSLTIEYPDALSDTTTAATLQEVASPHGGAGSSGRTARIDSRVQSRGGEQLLSVSDTEYTDSSETPFQKAPFRTFSGEGSISGVATGGQSVLVTFDPAFSLTTVFPESGMAAPDWILEGEMQARAADGSTMTATAVNELHSLPRAFSMEDSRSYENANVDYTVTYGTATLKQSKSFNSFQFPISRPHSDPD